MFLFKSPLKAILRVERKSVIPRDAVARDFSADKWIYFFTPPRTHGQYLERELTLSRPGKGKGGRGGLGSCLRRLLTWITFNIWTNGVKLQDFLGNLSGNKFVPSITIEWLWCCHGSQFFDRPLLSENETFQSAQTLWPADGRQEKKEKKPFFFYLIFHRRNHAAKNNSSSPVSPGD